MASRLLTFFVWALVAASGLFWGLKIFVKAPGLPPEVQTAGRMSGLGGDLSKVLGVVVAPSPETAPVNTNYKLLGVVAPREGGGGGLALISVGDQPARAWRVGAAVDGTTVLLAVGKRTASLGPRGGPATAELSLPELPAPATGTLPPPISGIERVAPGPQMGGRVPQASRSNDEEE